MAALIAAIVAIIGAVISFIANRWATRAEILKVEIELARRLTEKLYDTRLDIYPIAFEITDGLRGKHVFNPDTKHEYLEDIWQCLLEWHKRNGLFLSDETIKSYIALRRGLEDIIESKKELTETNLQPIWKAKNNFRTSMRKDLNLLYVEEQPKKGQP